MLKAIIRKLAERVAMGIRANALYFTPVKKSPSTSLFVVALLHTSGSFFLENDFFVEAFLAA